MDYAVRVEQLTKRYTLGAEQSAPTTFAEALTDALRFRRRAHGAAATAERDFWALNGVSFELKPGEVLGVIGRNGAGKSTLLKILSRITPPTSGRARLRGRVGSLLEVGTGFHQELTGRENIFLNGAILGMAQAEIARKLDEIIEYAGVAKFIDTPVKRYSSGMQVRLAFSVAAHLEPEILIIDEVLAVGDAEFQRKCLGKMQDAVTSGRTVLFVSHNMPAIAQLTKRCIVLGDGKILFDGPTEPAIREYISLKVNRMWSGRLPVEQIACDRRWRGKYDAWIDEIGFASGQEEEIAAGDSVRFDLLLHARVPTEGVRLAYSINSRSGQCLFTGISPPFRLDEGQRRVELAIEQIDLVPGEYDFSLSLGTGQLPDAKGEWDCHLGFGRLLIAERRRDQSAFGSWDRCWAPVVHTASQIALREPA